MKSASILQFTLIAIAASATAAPNDIPQWRGPNRDGNFPATGLLKEWPTDGPKLAWKTEKLGKGMSSVAIADGRESQAATIRAR